MEEASEREKTALSSLQSISDPCSVIAMCVFCYFMVLNRSSSTDARNEFEDLRQELARVDG